ncbi:MAG: hypothetical protein Q8M07_11090, partial [Prosthecobacter sp.]|nr:hypothetical protein [Prosthecobacter sp.]
KLFDLDLRSLTGCTVIAVEDQGRRVVNPPADYQLPATGRMFLIGTIAAEDQFLRIFQPNVNSAKKRSR